MREIILVTPLAFTKYEIILVRMFQTQLFVVIPGEYTRSEQL